PLAPRNRQGKAGGLGDRAPRGLSTRADRLAVVGTAEERFAKGRWQQGIGRTTACLGVHFDEVAGWTRWAVQRGLTTGTRSAEGRRPGTTNRRDVGVAVQGVVRGVRIGSCVGSRGAIAWIGIAR